MATKGANAISKHYALERIQTALNRLLDDASLDPIDIARTHRYPEALHSQQLEAIADALEQLSPAPEVEPETWEHHIDFTVSDGGFVAGEARDRELRAAQELSSAVLNVKKQQSESELAITSSTLETVDDFTVTGDGVIVATDEDGNPVVSDGQDEPDDLEDVDFDDPSDDEDQKPARKRKGK